MGRRYTNPPVIEALCEFQFEQDSSWDFTFLGLVYERVKDIFFKRQQLQVNVGAPISQELTGQVGILPTIPLVRYLNSDSNALVQVGQNILTINHLKPYPSWKNFFPLIEKAFVAYLDVVQPKKFKHVALRYINRISIPRERISLETYLNFYPFIAQDLPQNLDNFFIAVNLPYEDTKDVLRIQLTTITAEIPSTVNILLEIGYIFAEPEEIVLHDILEKIDVAHELVGKAFESCITDELRHIFGEVKE